MDIDYTQIPLGVIPSIKSPSDYKFSEVKNSIAMATIIPIEFCWEKPPIKNQGNNSSCVGNAFAYTREHTEWKQSKIWKQFSVGFIYGNREDTDYQGEGMMPKQAASSICKYGDTLFSDFPYDNSYTTVKQLINQNKETLLKKAYPYRISSYYAVDPTNIDEMKIALLNLGPIPISVSVYESFYKPWNNIIPLPDMNTEKLIGGHEMVIWGWDRYGHWIVLNSWGDKWCEQGFCRMSYSFPISEAYAITDGILPDGKQLDITFDVSLANIYDTEDSANNSLGYIKTWMFSKLPVNMLDTIKIIKQAENEYRIIFDSFTIKDKATALLNKILGYYPANTKVKIIPRYIVNKSIKLIVSFDFDKTTAEDTMKDWNTFYFNTTYFTKEDLTSVQALSILKAKDSEEYYIVLGEFSTEVEAKNYIEFLNKHIVGIKDIISLLNS